MRTSEHISPDQEFQRTKFRMMFLVTIILICASVVWITVAVIHAVVTGKTELFLALWGAVAPFVAGAAGFQLRRQRNRQDEEDRPRADSVSFTRRRSSEDDEFPLFDDSREQVTSSR